MHRAVLLVLALVALPAQANELGQGIHVRRVTSPATPLAGVKTIAVGKVDGNYAGSLAKEVADELANPDRKLPGDSQGAARAAGNVAAGAAAYAASALTFGLAAGAAYKAVDDANDKKLEANIRKIEDGLTIMPYKIVTSGAEATFVASVSGDSEDTPYTSTERRTDSNGYSYDATILCRKRAVSITLKWAFVDKSGKQLAGNTEDLSTSRSACEEGVKSIPTATAIAASAIQGVAPRIVQSVVPSWSDTRIDLDGYKTVKDALKDAKEGELKAGLCKAHAAAETEQKSNIPKYDEAAFLEGLGYLDQAIESYDAADKIKNYKGAEKGKERAEARQADIAKLEKDWGMKYTIGKFDWASCE